MAKMLVLISHTVDGNATRSVVASCYRSLMWPANIICGRKNGGFRGISGNFTWNARATGGGGFIAVGRLTNSRLVMVTVVYRAGNTRNTVAIMNENLMIHYYAHRVERYFVNIEALERREKI